MTDEPKSGLEIIHEASAAMSPVREGVGAANGRLNAWTAMWNPVGKPEMERLGNEVLLWKAEWVHPDFTPKGIRVGYFQEGEPGEEHFVVARYCSTHDTYETDNLLNPADWPTHWCPILELHEAAPRPTSDEDDLTAVYMAGFERGKDTALGQAHSKASDDARDAARMSACNQHGWHIEATPTGRWAVNVPGGIQCFGIGDTINTAIDSAIARQAEGGTE